MFADGRRQKAYLWYARYSELKKIQFWQSVVDDVDRLTFRRDPSSRVGRLAQELRQLERELSREYLRGVALQERWSGVLPDWISAQPLAAGQTREQPSALPVSPPALGQAFPSPVFPSPAAPAVKPRSGRPS